MADHTRFTSDTSKTKKRKFEGAEDTENKPKRQKSFWERECDRLDGHKRFESSLEMISEIDEQKERISQESASLPETLSDAFRGVRERPDERQSEIDSLVGGTASHRKSDTNLPSETQASDELAREIASLEITSKPEQEQAEGADGEDLPIPKEDIENLESYESRTREKFLELSRKYEDLQTRAREAYYESRTNFKAKAMAIADNSEGAKELLRRFEEATRESEAKVSSHETTNSMREEQEEYEKEITGLPREKYGIWFIMRKQVEIEESGHLAAMREINQAMCDLKDISKELFTENIYNRTLAALSEYEAASNAPEPEQEEAKREEGEHHGEIGKLRKDVEQLRAYESRTREKFLTKFLELSRAYKDGRATAHRAYREKYDESKKFIEAMAENDEEAEEFLRRFEEATRESEAKVSSHETINSMREEQKAYEEKIAAISNEKTPFSRKKIDIWLARRQQIEIEKMGHLAAMREINQAMCDLKSASEEIMAYSDAKEALADLDKI